MHSKLHVGFAIEDQKEASVWVEVKGNQLQGLRILPLRKWELEIRWKTFLQSSVPVL